MQSSEKKENRKALILYSLFSMMKGFSVLVMYYASGLVLNTLYAGIGTTVVLLIGLAVSLGAFIGRYLFARLADNAVEEAELAPKEMHDVRTVSLLCQDLFTAVFAVFLAGKAGLFIPAGIVCVWLIRMFLKQYRYTEPLPLYISIALTLFFSMHALETGRAGLYGIIMTMFLCMDLINAHSSEYGSGRVKGIFSQAMSLCGNTALAGMFITAAMETARVLGYRVPLSKGISMALMAVMAVGGALCHMVKDPDEDTNHAEMIYALVLTAVCFMVNPYCGLLMTSGAIAVSVLPRLFRFETDKGNAVSGVLKLVFLAVLIGGGYALYWHALASFDEIFYSVILYMSVSMGMDAENRGEEEDGELECAEDPAGDLSDPDQSDQSLDVRD